MIRILDITFATIGLIILAPLFLVIYLLGLLDTGSPLFVQTRVGKSKSLFQMYKFRTMAVCTASVATHLADSAAITPLGQILRATKLDELPQLMNVLKGEMSLVGPRPCLPNQHELIESRDRFGIFDFRPGITGLAQIKGIDMSNPTQLAEVEKTMLAGFSWRNYFYYIFATFNRNALADRVRP
ncbi:MAG: sugar transferase [Deltaproteobacteria bacterium]|nr:sugar transferase [Deltaproteobacteria bacterium]